MSFDLSSIDKLKSIGATDITMKVNESGIVKICFKLNDVQIHAQADIDNSGIYAIEVPSLQGLAKLINKGESL
jgi:hypothetical protein